MLSLKISFVYCNGEIAFFICVNEHSNQPVSFILLRIAMPIVIIWSVHKQIPHVCFLVVVGVLMSSIMHWVGLESSGQSFLTSMHAIT